MYRNRGVLITALLLCGMSPELLAGPPRRGPDLPPMLPARKPVRVIPTLRPPMKTWTITDNASDGSTASTHEAPTSFEALTAMAADHGFNTFADFCRARDRELKDFGVFKDRPSACERRHKRKASARHKRKCGW